MRDTEREPRRRGAAVSKRSLARLTMMLLCASLFAVAGVACTGAGATDPTPVQTWMITPAGYTATTAATPTPTTVESEGSGGAIKLVGRDAKYDLSALAAAAGTVTIDFSNEDGGVVHNLHVFKGSDAKGESMGQTELATGPIDRELKLELTAGTYYYQCDAHPATMKGTLTVH